MHADALSIRVLNDPPLNGLANMARDDTLLIRVGELESPPSLRLYQWAEPTISLGYFQPYADYETLPPPAGALAVVRRTTGGGAILHDIELTYSLTLPAGHPLLSDGANRLYELAHQAVIAALALLGVAATRCGVSDGSGAAHGPFFCFERRHRYDVVLDDRARRRDVDSSHNSWRRDCPPVACAPGSDSHRAAYDPSGREKIAGSAQRRTRQAILQHGSIVLGNRYNQQLTAGVPVPFEQAVYRMRSNLVTHLAERTGLAFEPGDWSREELSHADTLISKYADCEWTRRI